MYKQYSKGWVDLRFFFYIFSKASVDVSLVPYAEVVKSAKKKLGQLTH
jgi:hypothetical protein